MSIQDLIKDSQTSFDAETASLVDRRTFSAALRHVSQFAFWTKTAKEKALWQHQQRAIESTIAYLSADPHLPERPLVREAALLKLPTGTGKSGIVAVLTRCLPKVKRALVLTPRQSLVSQMSDDIRFRFWGHLGYDVTAGKTFTADSSVIGAELADVYVETLLPSRSDIILHHVPASERSVIVGTYQALDLIRKRAKDARPERAAKRKSAEDVLTLLGTFDLVLVDEGHYEPAVSWSKGVRDLNRPTVLLSATPYRNDFKSFRVRGRFVFNYPHGRAVHARIIRDVEIARAEPRGRGSAAEKFVNALARQLPGLLAQASAWTPTPKVMVRAHDFEKLHDLQRLIDRAFGTQSVLVHDRARPSPQFRRRYQSVRRAMRECGDAAFWLHQFKLMEGVDDPDFVVAAIFDLPTNGRQLVQQIGRIVRTSPGRIRKQTAWVIATSENAQRIDATWMRYKGYEKYCAEETRHIVVNEIALPDRVLELMPQNQYIGGDFRERFDAAAALSSKDLQLPTSAAVFKWGAPARAIAELAEAAEDALMQVDRFRIVPLADLPANCIGFTYYAWRNSPLLIDKFFSEWKLGIFIAVQHGDLVMVHDTEGIVLDAEVLGLKTAPRRVLEQAFPVSRAARASRLTRMSFGSLDMSEQAIRTLAVRTRAFETTFTDLLDPNLVPTAASGFVGGRGRYIGFAKARFRDSTERRLPAVDYIAWTASVARELTRPGARSGVFDRYALVRDDITPVGATPQTILLNLSRDELLEGTDPQSEARTLAADPDIDHDDLCADVDPEGKFKVTVLGKPVECQISYNPETERYRFHSEVLNEIFRQRETGDQAHAPTASQRISAEQSFRILIAAANVVYAEKRFFEPRIALRQPDGSVPILDDVNAVDALAAAKSEKGEAFFGDRGQWQAESLFGAIDAICASVKRVALRRWQALGERLSSFPLVVCDDDSKEIADFIALDPQGKRVAFIHAKSSNRGSQTYNVDALQAVGRQATASLAFLSRSAPTGNWTPERWTRDVQANKVVLTGRSRTFKNNENLTPQQISNALASACGNATYDREVWIVAGNMIERSVIAAMVRNNEIDNRLRQFLMHWDGLRIACARAGSRLRLFCH
jgi:superfamily II DNA or RNA helicase